jgi:hypothetical protein
MKNELRVFALFLFCFLFQNLATAQNKEILVATHYECYTNDDYNKILVTNADSKVEEIAMKQFGTRSLESNQITFTRLITKYKNAGYKIIAQTCGNLNIMGGYTVLKTTLILEKE